MVNKAKPKSGSSRRPPGCVSLDRALSKLGLASRTQARELILAGKVRVNGAIKTNPGFALRPETAQIEIDGIKREPEAWRTILFHKPRSVVTTRSDEKGRKTVFSVLGDQAGNLQAVGRLDLATSGALLLTNDTRLASWLTDPENQVPRVYLVSVQGEFPADAIPDILKGILDQGELLQADQVEIRKTSSRESHLVVQLRQGKNREIRRIFSLLGHEVTRLKRVAFGGIELGDLELGQFREISSEEIRALFPEAPIRK